jgi:hypothetical protein
MEMVKFGIHLEEDLPFFDDAAFNMHSLFEKTARLVSIRKESFPDES